MFEEIENEIQSKIINLVTVLNYEKDSGVNLDPKTNDKKYSRKAWTNEDNYRYRVDEHYRRANGQNPKYVDFTILFEKTDNNDVYIRNINYNEGNGLIDSGWNLQVDEII